MRTIGPPHTQQVFIRRGIKSGFDLKGCVLTSVKPDHRAVYRTVSRDGIQGTSTNAKGVTAGPNAIRHAVSIAPASACDRRSPAGEVAATGLAAGGDSISRDHRHNVRPLCLTASPS